MRFLFDNLTEQWACMSFCIWLASFSVIITRTLMKLWMNEFHRERNLGKKSVQRKMRTFEITSTIYFFIELIHIKDNIRIFNTNRPSPSHMVVCNRNSRLHGRLHSRHSVRPSQRRNNLMRTKKKTRIKWILFHFSLFEFRFFHSIELIITRNTFLF